MAVKRAFVQVFSTPIPVSGWRGAAWLGVAVAIFLALPEARALVTAGVLGGIVIAAVLILLRQATGSGPRRGTPIALFGHERIGASTLLTRHQSTRGFAAV